jgi:CHAT domain-containing protein
LLLEKGDEDPLTVADLRDRYFEGNTPFLAYLSACSTGANQVDKLVDEAIHLISAFQLSGFRHVVGTLWEVQDKACVDVARILYETLRDKGSTDDAAVSLGLHLAVRALRDGGVRNPPTTTNTKTEHSGSTASTKVRLCTNEV